MREKRHLILQVLQLSLIYFEFRVIRRTVCRHANNSQSISFNRRQGIEEALKQVDGSSETVVNTLREYVVMNSTLKSILQQVRLWLRVIGVRLFAFLEIFWFLVSE